MAVELAAEKLITYAVIITEATTAHVRRSWRQQTVVVFINSLCYYTSCSADDFRDQDHDDVTIELRKGAKNRGTPNI